jgi:hypothetical protein
MHLMTANPVVFYRSSFGLKTNDRAGLTSNGEHSCER